MPWYFPWSDSIKKRACRYLLQHYLGHFLKEKLTLDQLSVNLYDGTGTIQDVLLDVLSLNEALENYNVPIEIVDGFVGSISVTIPWSALVSDSTMVEIRNLELTVQPKQRTEQPGVVTGVMLDSMFGSMTTSMQLAQECLKQETSDAGNAQPFEGLEMFAQTIEAVLTRIKVTFIDTIIRLEHLPREAKTGAALEIRINRVEYFDDQAVDQGSSVDHPPDADSKSVYEPAAFAHKNFHLMGVTMFCDEFLESQRTFSRTPSEACSPLSPRFDNLSASPDLPPGASIYHSTTQDLPSGGATLPQSDPVKIAVLHGRQEIKLKVKQNEQLAGPKLELDVILGSVNVHLSPRQVHLLLEIANGLAVPGSCDDSNVRKKGAANKPMSDVDYERVEHELQRQLQHDRMGMQQERASRPYHWSDDIMTIQSLDDDEEEDVYFDLGASQSGMSSMESSVASSIKSTSTTSTASAFFNYGPGYARRESPFQSTLPPGARKPKSPHKKDILPRLLDDPSAEVTRYRLKLNFLSVVVLHEDPPAAPTDGFEPPTTLAQRLKVMAENYFSRALGISTKGMGTDLVQVRQQFTEACPFDHLGFLGKPLNLECNQKSTPVIQSLSVDLTIGLAEVVECVFDRRGTTHSHFGFSLPIENVLPDYCLLLTFVQDVPDVRPSPMFSSMQASAPPCVRLKVTSVEKTSQSRRPAIMPKTEVHLELAHCQSEVDITIIDRIQALLTPQPLTKTNGNGGGSVFKSQHPSLNQSRQACFSQVINENGGSDQRLDLRLSSPRIELSFRFPIPDLRNEPGLTKLPWWCRSLRKEQLLLDLTDADFQTSHTSSDMVTKFEVIWKELQVLFKEAPEKEPICFGKITPDGTPGNERDDGFNWPRLAVTIFPELHSVLEEDTEETEDNTPGDSLNGACQFTKPPPSPFSSRKAMYDNEELVMPGDREETREFQEKAVANTQLLIELSLPRVHAILPDKDFFELLYNRINNDLLLWEPLAPAPLAPPEPQQIAPPWGLDLATQLMHTAAPTNRFMLCKSGIQYDSSSDSEEEESGQFYSLHEAKQRQRRKARQEQQNRQSKLCVNLTIGTGRLTAYVPLRDEEKKVRTDKQGEFLLDLSDAAMFTVVAHNGDPDLQYLCIHSNRATLFHAGCVDIPSTPPSLQYLPLVPPAHLVPTIYLSDPGVTTRLGGQVGRGPDSADMLSIALRIKVDTFRNVKEFQVALGIRGGTLRHRTPETGESWFTQMLDFFAVTDQQILGYTWPKVVTELHCHLWSCAIDYRPLYIPLRAVLTVETFSISSNIIAESPTSLLRFIVQDAALYISDKCNEQGVDLKRNYVCVIDLGVFELSLRTSDGKDTKNEVKKSESEGAECVSDGSTPSVRPTTQRYPKLDLRASNNIVHVRTCSDSCSALAELIQYIASDGDCQVDGSERDAASTTSQPTAASEPSMSGSPQLTHSHLEQVHDMMADAMRESTGSDSQDDSDGEARTPAAGGPTEIFFFPGESDPAPLPTPGSPALSGARPSSVQSTPTRQVMLTMSESDDSVICTAVETDELHEPITDDYYSPDEEFCIIDDPGLGIVPRDGEPTIRQLVKTTITVVDNHFAQPLGKSDQLKAPEHFPPAVCRYTLREMSLVWYMYGGHDLSAKKKDKKPELSSMQGANRPSSTSRLGRVGWQARGGPGRDIDTLMELQLNKVRLQHEVFLETAEQASRQILLINEVELRDRLASSKINKFLYQYTSDTLPRQAHANMVVLKALHHRPDPALPAQECSLRVSLLPLRLNIDQDALFFLRNFFTTISEDSRESSPAHGRDTPVSPAKGKQTPAPVMTVGPSSSPSPADQEALLIMFDEIEQRNEDDEDLEGEEDDEEEDTVKSQPIYFKSFVFSPDVPIRLDYHGKRVDMEHGTLAGLLVGLAQLNCSELSLKRINHRHGLLGFERLALYTLNEWLQDLKKNQLPSILGGVGPMYSIVQLLQGIRDLFWLPVEQYRKDGRIVRGIQRGAHSFTTSTAMAALELTNRLVQTVQYAAEVAYDMVSPGPSVRSKRYSKRRRVGQPADLREGMSNAMTVVKDGFSGTASNIARAACEEHEMKGMTGAVGGVLRQIPPTILQPVIIATEATSNVLGGMRNQLRPDRKREDEDKWKPEDS